MTVDINPSAFLVYDIDPISERIGTFDPQLAEEFWRAFTFAAGITLHMTSLAGRTGHHVIEASFQGVARSLRDAIRVESNALPTTKGAL